MSVTAHLVVQFSASASSGQSSGLSAEVDSRLDGLNNGVTDFLPGQTAYILVWPTGTAVVDQVLPSAGTVIAAGEASVFLEETLQFANTDEATTRRKVTDSASWTWLGNSLGDITFDGTKAKAQVKGVALATVKYRAVAKVYALTSPNSVAGLRTFDILVVVTGHDDT